LPVSINPLEDSRKQLGLDTVARLHARCLHQLHQESERRLWRQFGQPFTPAIAQHYMTVAAGYLYESSPMLAERDVRALVLEFCPRRYAACHRFVLLEKTSATRQ
jgi:hypothetical protein